MQIELENVGKRFSSGWVFKDVSLIINSGQKFSITGLNGSGKSTLINILCGYLSNTKGKVNYTFDGKKIDRDNIYKHCAISFAYAELDEELTVLEIFDHYQKFKSFKITDPSTFLEICDLKKHSDKAVGNFSSGMKQRLSLSLSFLMDTSLLLLDEPTSFLDSEKKSWFHSMMEKYTENRTVIIASNDEADINLCTGNYNMSSN